MNENRSDYAIPVACCRQCDTTWRPSGRTARENCPACGKTKDVRKRKVAPDIEKIKAWRAQNPGQSTKSEQRYRRRALLIVGGSKIACVRCGCDRPELIEINHKNGGGRPELKSIGKLWSRVIARLERDPSDLELLCRPCNAVHYLELKHGPLPFRVTWGRRPKMMPRDWRTTDAQPTQRRRYASVTHKWEQLTQRFSCAEADWRRTGDE